MFKIKLVGNPWFLFGGWRGERFLASSDTQHDPWHPLVCKHVTLTSVSGTTWTSTLNLPACSLIQAALPPVCIQMSLPFQEYQSEDWWPILMELFFQASHLLDGHELSKDTVCSTKYLFQWSFSCSHLFSPKWQGVYGLLGSKPCRYCLLTALSSTQDCRWVSHRGSSLPLGGPSCQRLALPLELGFTVSIHVEVFQTRLCMNKPQMRRPLTNRRMHHHPIPQSSVPRPLICTQMSPGTNL